MVCTLSFGEISNIHDGLHIRLASALLSEKKGKMHIAMAHEIS